MMQLFRACANGHDLTTEDSYYYTASGLRFCRQCEVNRKQPKRNRFNLK